MVRGTVLAAMMGFLTVIVSAPALAQSPYEPPPFTCEFHQFGEGEAPDVTAYPDDPLCVEYQKRDITVSTGGAVWFLAAEPSRVAIAADKCQYWQIDHWSVQIAPDTTAVVRWDGSYWFDRGLGIGGAQLDAFQIGEQPVGFEQAAQFVEPYSSELADGFREYGSNPEGGGGSSFALPGGSPDCPAGDGTEPAPDASEPPADTAADTSADTGTDRLPRTGGGVAAVASMLLGLGVGLRRWAGGR